MTPIEALRKIKAMTENINGVRIINSIATEALASYKGVEDLDQEKEAEIKGATGSFIVNNGYQIHVKHGLITKIENIDE